MNQTSTIPTWRLNLQMIRYQWRAFSLHFIFSILVFAEQLAPGLIIKAIFDRLSGAVGPENNQLLGLNFLWWLIILYLLIEFARLFLAIGYEWFGMTFRLLNFTLLNSNLFGSILRRRGDQPLPVSAGEALNRFRWHEDMGEVCDFPTWIPDQVSKWIAAAVAVVIMARINLPITLVIFLPLIGIMFITRLFWGRMLAYDRQARVANDAVTGFLGESFGSVQAVKVAGAEADVVARLRRLNDNLRAIHLRLTLFRGLLNALNESVVNFGIGVILLMAGISPNVMLWVGPFTTFHSACVRILRQQIEPLGFKRNFVIYDEQDQERHLKSVMKEPETDRAVQTTPPITRALIMPELPVSPICTSTNEERMRVISVIPDTGFVPTIAMAFAATVVKRNETIVTSSRPTTAWKKSGVTPRTKKTKISSAVRRRKITLNIIGMSLWVRSVVSDPAGFRRAISL